MNRGRIAALFAPIVVFIVAQIQRAQPLAWDEIEFFRATKWIAEGLMPYRDYWEHHTPLQWFVFAPFAAVFGRGPGVSSVLAMRWAQVPLWIAASFLLLRMLRDARVSAVARWSALALLLSARAFVATAIQYRVDTLGNVAFIAGVVLLLKRRYLAFGVVMSMAVLANMRLVPLVVLAAVICCVTDGERWRVNVRALTIAVGVVIVAGAFISLIVAMGAWPGFVDGVVRYNMISNRLAEPVAGNTLAPVLFAPVVTVDVAAIALWVLACIGAGIALKPIRTVGAMQVITILFVGSLVAIAVTAVQYDYHMQTSWLLMMPLAALTLDRAFARADRIVWIVAATAGAAVLANFATLFTPAFGKGLEYQNLIMTEADRRTPSNGKVWDGTGYALRRDPAYRYWFLAGGVRLMAERGLLPQYDIRRDPPDAIIYNYRLHRWLLSFPDFARYVPRHYLPLYRNLLLPGMSATVGEQPTRTVWRVPATAQYDVWASDLLAKHPWFARPLEYGMIEGEDAVLMRIPLEQLPPFEYATLQFFVDGVPVPKGTRTITLKKGSRLELITRQPQRTGVMLVMHGIRELCVAPEESFVF